MSYKSGDKFVIEIEDIGNGLYRAVPFKTLVFDKYGLDQLGQLVQGVDTFSYNKGLEDAWELARKICKTDDSGFSIEEMLKIFHSSSIVNCFEKFSAYEALNRYKAWQEKNATDWSKVAVDTPILVRDDESQSWKKRYFAKYEKEEVYAYEAGRTSWSAVGGMISWPYAKLAEGSEE